MDKLKYDFDIDTAELNSSHMALLRRIKQGERILELGCATGYLSKILSRQMNCHVVGVDSDPQAIAKARQHCDKVIVANLERDDLQAELGDALFDVLLFADVLEHLRNPIAVLQSLKPLLKKNGRILLSIPNIAHASIRLELLQGHFDYERLGLLDETHLHFYSRDSLFNMLMDAGFVCTGIDYTVHDMADEAICEHLERMGLTPTEQTLEKFHAPEAQAYQFIVEAVPASDDVLSYRYPALQPKPLETSNIFYAQKQQKIEQLQEQLVQLQSYCNELEIQRDNMDQHVDNLQQRFSNLEQSRENLKRDNHCLSADVERLEAVLRRVHNKRSYRLLQACRKTIRNVKVLLSTFSPEQKTVEIPEFVDFLEGYSEWVEKYDTFNEDRRLALLSEIKQFKNPPTIAIVMPVFNTEKEYLIAAIESVCQQVYPHWALCIADDGSDLPHVKDILEHYAEQDKRIKLAFLDKNSGIADASNAALELVQADNVALMDHDDILTPDALFQVAKAFIDNPQIKLIYSDEDKLGVSGKRYNAYFKPDWNPALSLSHNFICHLGVYKTDRVKKLGGFRSCFDGAQDYDLMLRYVETIEAKEIYHITKVLYHWRAITGSTAIGLQEKPYAEDAIRRAVEDAIQRRGLYADVLKHETIPGAIRVKYHLPPTQPLVSIIIPTRNAYYLLRRCVESIVNKTSYQQYEILVIDNGSDDFKTLSYLRCIQQRIQVRVIRDERPFNYAALNNAAVKQARGSIIALLNNDLEVIAPEWLEEMVSHVIRPEIGAVGAKLLYPNGTIQHAGVITGLGGVAGHSHKHFPGHDVGYCGRLQLIQNLSAVTAACMVLEKQVFDEVGGFDEENLAVAFNDVDLCLRIIDRGYLNLWTPYAQFYHYESASRGYEDTPEKQARFAKEVEFMKNRWGAVRLLNDPAYNPNLTLKTEDFALRWFDEE